MAVGTDELATASLVDLAVDRLRQEILSGDLPPGTRLVEEQIRGRFGISRGPLREALRLLAEQGLVEHLPRRGVRVATLSDQDVAELFDVRDVLERHAVGVAFASADPGPDLDGVRRELTAMRAAASADDAFRAAEAHRRYHAEVVALAGRRQLCAVYEPILVRLQVHMATNLRREARARAPRDGVLRHERLLAALEGGDAPTVLAALATHGAQTYL